MKILMKTKLMAFLLVIINVFVLTGCWNYTEMDEQLNVSAMAIDYGNSGQKYHITVEVLTEGEIGKESIGSQTLETNGDTVFEAFRKFITVASKKLYFGHCKVVIIGEEVAKKGMSEVLDLLVRDHEVRMTMNVLVSKGCKAKEILKTQSIDDPIMGYHIAQIISTSAKSGAKSLRIQIFEIYNLLHTQGREIILPAFELYETQNYKTFRTTHFGVFKKDKLVGYLDQDDRKLYTILTNERKKGILNYKLPGSKDSFIAFEMHDAKTKIKPIFVEGRLSFNIDVKSEVSIGETQCAVKFCDEKSLKALKEGFENYLEQRMSNIIKQTQQQLNADIIGLGDILHMKMPKVWEQYKDNWNETYRNVGINVDYKVDIRDSGVIRNPVKVGG